MVKKFKNVRVDPKAHHNVRMAAAIWDVSVQSVWIALANLVTKLKKKKLPRAFSWHVAQIAVNDTLESLHLQQEQAISQLTEWKGPKAAIAATEQHQKDKNTKKPSSDEKENKFPSLLTPRNTNASALSNSSTSLYAASSFDDSAALRSFMLSHANFSMTARAALAAAAAAGMSYASGSAADLAPGFDMWSRGSDPGLTQKEWVDFYAALHRTAARAYWTIGKRAGAGAVAPECCGEEEEEKRREVFFFFGSTFFFLSLSQSFSLSHFLSFFISSPPTTQTPPQLHTQVSLPRGSSRSPRSCRCRWARPLSRCLRPAPRQTPCASTATATASRWRRAEAAAAAAAATTTAPPPPRPGATRPR